MAYIQAQPKLDVVVDVPPDRTIVFNQDDYSTWCQTHGYVDYHYDRVNDYIMQVQLESWALDPPDYPGGCHAVQLLLGTPLKRNVDYSSELCETQTRVVREALLNKYANLRVGDRFEVGKLVGGHWRITGVLAGAEGCFNRGIFHVVDEFSGKHGILKLLPTEAMHSDYAAREMTIQAGLKHPNIVELCDSYLPRYCHDTPWIITQYCDKHTLKDLLSLRIEKKQPVPELFIWQVFEALIYAVEYCHHGNVGAKNWDPISHRDIILGNVFLKTGVANSTNEYPVEIRMGDFGCAISKSEMMNKNLGEHDLPCEDYLYVPPEGAMPSEAADIYQVGLIVWCFFCLAPRPDKRIVAPFARGSWRPKACIYTEDLHRCISACLHKDPRMRPSAGTLTRVLWGKRVALLEKKLLKYEEMPFL